MTTRKSRHTFALSTLALAISAALRSTPAAAQIPPQPTEGQEVENPLTGDMETVTAILSDPAYSVRTLEGNIIWTGPITVGHEFTLEYRAGRPAQNGAPAIPERPGGTYRVTDVTEVNGRITEVFYELDVDDPPPEASFETLAFVGNQIIDGGDGDGERPVPAPPAGNGTNENQWLDRTYGANGYNGDHGWGVEICIFDCWTIGEGAEMGGPGHPGQTRAYAVNGPDASIESDNQHGVWISARGGDGGAGGNAYGILPAARGGTAGPGGTVDVTNNRNVVTTGTDSYGVFAQSRAGIGGGGGSGYGISEAGTGGAAAQGGQATLVNNADVTTWGEGSIGVYVQSLGGGGGSSGDSFGLVGDGGDGSEGGHGGNATLVNHGRVETHGLNAHGLYVHSVGGRGGDAGTSGGIAGLSGNGQSGGDGGAVSLTNDGVVITRSAYSHGVVAQSLGGGGGNGGDSAGVGAIGGSGSSGGNGNNVLVNNDRVSELVYGQIETFGLNSHGILAESIGGGGGNGGSGAGVVGIGGTGTGGGIGRQVVVSNDGLIATHGDYSQGILAHSIGGGGGAGGNGDGLAGIGGDSVQAGPPSNGGEVLVTNEDDGRIITFGRDSTGILAQSIGGGGGAGAGSGGLASIGGQGASGGDGTHVHVINDGSILTQGIDSRGIVAQSIGGGGGSASNSGGLVEIGGAGAGGGNGGAVEVDNRGSVRTQRRGGDALLAQSIGGGGGNGSSSDGAVGIGGSGSGGGNGGAVRVTNSGLVQTQGDRARGVVAESIGGGGGNGGDGGGLVAIGGSAGAGGGSANPDNGGRVDVNNGGAIDTAGRFASAIDARSVGGGGGTGGSSTGAFMVIGGSGGAGGAGGQVHIDNDRDLATLGNDSHGIYAQSIGGGGGNGGNAVSLSAFGGAAVGGQGGAASNGDLVRISGGLDAVGNPLTTTPVIRTEGDRAKGVFAQSVGGGGGNGGFAVQATAGYGIGASMAVGGNGGAAGNGGSVDVDARQNVFTSGQDADGMLAQSVGGGGGNGGFAVSFAGAAGDVGAGSLAAAVGGNGAAGGTGGAVDIDAGGIIFTRGAMSEGIVAQSVGGGGGTGGFAITLSAAVAGGGAGSVAAAVGGGGGVGGNAGGVELDYAGSIVTEGADSAAVLSQAVGGGGGNGGYTISGAVAGAGGGAGAVAVGVAGTGGGGGEGGVVVSHVQGSLMTAGDRSLGLIAQSVGGRGGNGGFNVSGAIAGAGGGAGGVAVGIGGAGGGGGSGGTAEGRLTGGAMTQGRDSDAVLVQSVGGGGGNGGFNVSGAIAAAGSGAGAVSVGIGGSGGNAGSGRLATAVITGDLTTHGDGSSGLVVQSVGGGGGNGGFNVTGSIAAAGAGAGGVSVGLGGSGGGGGAGGVVSATVSGSTSTRGDDATAIVAQSLGGGGGNGGFNVSASVSGAGSASGAVSVGLGGSGGAGGISDQTTLLVTGDTFTEGERSGGIVAQSVGGGGGNGGFNVSGAISGAGSSSGAIAVGIGGSGGTGARAGGAVDATVTGNVVTMGGNATGFVAQSIGGGGGNGGFDVTGAISGAGGTAGAVSVGLGGAGGSGGDAALVRGTLVGNLTTLGDGSDGVVVQSVGGGGGNGGFTVGGSIAGSGSTAGAVSVGLGGSGAGAGHGGEVVATVTGETVTAGDDASSIVAQSVGGGGGNGGFAVAGSIAGSGQSALGVSVGLGGAGGGGGNGNAVTATVTGIAATIGESATAVVVQSLGGGGGTGGMSVAGAVSGAGSGAGAVSIGLGGSGGGGGDGGLTTLDLAGHVETMGDGSTGVLVQSLGGGGGAGGISVAGALSAAGGQLSGAVAVGLGGSGGAGGDGRAVRASVEGTVLTRGADSMGAVFQSVGGGGGAGAMNISGAVSLSNSGAGSVALGIGGAGGAGGDAGDVLGAVNGNTFTTGDRSVGVLMQSVGGGGGAGGMNISGALALAKGAGGAAALGLGGLGGEGGHAGEVTGDVAGQVQTFGHSALGVLAQSVGGGGGNGGMNISGSVSATKQGGVAAALGVGGFGGGAGDGRAVTLRRTGDTYTSGANADVVVAQSIGGGGGAGGLNISGALSISTSGSAVSASLGVGGFGGEGGAGGDVTLEVAGDVGAVGFTNAAAVLEDSLIHEIIEGGAHGVLAQSIGGAGGRGGMNVSGGIALDASNNGSSHALTLGVGGFGGVGGDAGEVTVRIDAQQVSAVGDERYGVAVQSIGGGGGSGGMNVAGGIAMDGVITAGIGGFGGAGGSSDDVDATVNSNINAIGARAIGLLAQSVGGGGGSGAINVSGGIQGSRDSSTPSLVFGIGGSGGAGNISGDVSAMQSGDIQVAGSEAIGILAQSVAGGGGSGALNVSGNLALGRGYQAVIGIGGQAGDGADAGSVVLRSDGDIRVDGRGALDDSYDPDLDADAFAVAQMDSRQRANGILAQSVGGGGGQGGINVSGVIATAGDPIAVGIGGSGGGGGHAGRVTVHRGQTGAAMLQTWGNNATGITAQSVGGGGGNAAMNFLFSASTAAPEGQPPRQVVNIGVGGDGGAPGHGDEVEVLHRGDIATLGHHSYGLLAQSVGGGGGNATFNIGLGVNPDAKAFNLAVGGGPGDGGEGRRVHVDHRGDVTTLGNVSTALFAQSVGGGGGSAGMDMITSPFSAGGVDIGLGRIGGTGGRAGDVSVISDGALSTSGDRSAGIRAQSVGNAGGESSSTSVEFSGEGQGEGQDWSTSLEIGLGGGTGGAAGDVDVRAGGRIVTAGINAYGIHAQSVGGGGGTGGTIERHGIMEANNQVSIGVGGAGGLGAVGGNVRIDNDAQIDTQGFESHGVFAQSTGGGGGTGGAVIALDLEVSAITNPGGGSGGGNTFGLQVGGSGGEGGIAQSVTVNNTGNIFTTGFRSAGIDAQSLGGGGGQGGAIYSMGVSRGDNSRNIAITVGGAGDVGGDAGDVNVVNEGRVATTGDDAMGIRAQSTGGSGGDAGVLLELGVIALQSNDQARNLSIKVGGEGGTGGIGGDVVVANRAQDGDDAEGGIITTDGRGSHAIFAQSLGGGGGNGSSILTANVGASAGSQATLVNISVGGRGGSGGAAGDVVVENEALIDTWGDGAHGVFAQSVGGGGGNGGLVLAANAVLASADPANEAMITLGGHGGSGDDAGDVTVDNSGRIITRGARSHGVFAQSIGGGGGNAGIGFGLSADPEAMVIAGALSAAFGGEGGSGGRGGHVTVNHSGDITVLGENSHAVVAESINGGGGHVQLDFNGVTSLPGLPEQLFETIPLPGGIQTPTVIEFDGGGRGLSDMNAGLVTLNYTGTFGVVGRNGAANSVQAIGGGGGSYDLNLSLNDIEGARDDVAISGRLGGINGVNNDGGDIHSSHDGDLITEGDNTPGALVQSIGGGGGRANLMLTSAQDSIGAASLSLGGQGGASERGGDIEHRQSGAVVTSGIAAHGGVFQSVGGGGGSLTLLSNGSGENEGIRSGKPAEKSARAVQPQVSLGSSGGDLLSGGDVEVTLEGPVATVGDNALGMVFQSVGAGGGVANVSGAESSGVQLGGTAGASGNGGALRVTNTGNVVTEGRRSHGVFLQSIGGGGGALFTDAAAPAVTFSSANQGDGGAIDFTQQGTIAALGDQAYAVFAQSVGGGGGFVDGGFAASAGGGGAAGAITIELAGDVIATGNSSTALFAQSADAGGVGGDITATLQAGFQLIGGEDGVAVHYDGGASNRFTNHGEVFTLSGPLGYAFRGGSGSDFIENHGAVRGNVDLGSATGGFANHANAMFHSGTSVNLGDAFSVLRNDGVLSPGGQGLAVNSSLNGSFLQSATGDSRFEMDFGNREFDRIAATGTVNVAGTLNLDLFNVQHIRPGQWYVPVFEGAAGVVDSGIDFNPQESIVIRYSAMQTRANSLGYEYEVDFATRGLVGNRVQVGEYLNRVQLNGGPQALGDTITAAVLETDLGDYSSMLTQLGTEFYTDQQALALTGTQRFARNLQNCGTTLLAETAGDDTGCYWFRYDDNPSTRESRAGFPASKDSSYSISQGIQMPRDSGWNFGFGVDFEDHRSQGFDGLWTAESRFIQLGASARRQFDFGSLGATFSIGNNAQQVERLLAVTDARKAEGERNLMFLTSVVDWSRDFTRGGFTWQPTVSVGSGFHRHGGMTERGADAQAAVIMAGDETHVWVEPALAGRYTASFDSGASVRTFARLGVLHYVSGTSTKVRAGLAGAPREALPMRIGSDLDRTHLVGELGLQFEASGGFTVGFSYTQQQSRIREGGAGSLRFVLPLQ